MPLDVYIDRARSGRKRPGPLVVSLALHGAVFFAMMNAPEIKLPEQNKSEYQLAFQGKEEKLVWYKFNKELPDVTPLRAKAEPKPVRATLKAKQQIVASRKDAPQRTQVVWTPAPDLSKLQKLELPNVLAVKLSEVARPFVPPAPVQKQNASMKLPGNAPELKTQTADPVKLAEIPAKVTRQFVAPPQVLKETVNASISVPSNAPELRQQLSDPIKLAQLPKIPKPFVPPPAGVPGKKADISPVVQLAEAPRIDASLTSAPVEFDIKAPHRQFTAPPKASAPSLRQAAIEAPPSLPSTGALTPPGDVLNANSRELNLAVVGLNPANKADALPAASSPGRFAAGPKIRPDGADSTSNTKGVSVPDLYVGGANDAKPDLIAQTFAAPTSELNLRAAARLTTGRPAVQNEELSNPGAVKVSDAPDRRFDGRDVYMMAIQMPNLTSYSGSWLMWYADRTARQVGLAPVAPPVAHRKVDPKYIAAAVADRIEGKVQLACVIGKDGRVSNIELVRGIDDRLNQSAEEALSKWEFTPATRHGEPVEVDVLVEIPFRLEPVIRKSY
jgi:TonB family protein